jgi:DNA-directed RNA polymerase specialized sigma24 family protein
MISILQSNPDTVQVSLQTVASRLRYAIARLQEQLQSLYSEIK